MQLLPFLRPILDSQHGAAWRKRAVASIGCVAFLYGGASAIASFGDQLVAVPLFSGGRVAADLALPALDEQVERLQSREEQFTLQDRVRSGDTIAALLARLQVDDTGAQTFLRSDPIAQRLLQLRPGRAVTARTDASGALIDLRFPSPSDAGDAARFGPTARMTIVARAGERFVATEQAMQSERRVEMRSGEIHSSLFAATDKAGIPDAITQQIADIFESEIDFHSDLRESDRFRVVYETFWLDGEFVRPGRVLAIEFVNRSQAHRAAWFESEPGHSGYYGFDGHSVRRAFLRSPLEFSRVSSGFTGARLHPISQQWKAHHGIDYAAPSGTAIRSVADGIVEFAGWQNGYGNVVIVRHSGIYETLYAHMSGFASDIKKGAPIQQGQALGYVGMTGWATGPHLHYEFHVNGSPQNPLAIALPEAAPILPERRIAFDARMADLNHRLVLLNTVAAAASE